jgi:hypothetical protein
MRSPPRLPTWNSPRFFPSLARIFVTLPLAKLFTQILDPSKATQAGSFPVKKVARILPAIARSLVTVLPNPLAAYVYTVEGNAVWGIAN